MEDLSSIECVCPACRTHDDDVKLWYLLCLPVNTAVSLWRRFETDMTCISLGSRKRHGNWLCGMSTGKKGKCENTHIIETGTIHYIRKNLHITVYLIIIFGPDYYGIMFPRNNIDRLGTL